MRRWVRYVELDEELRPADQERFTTDQYSVAGLPPHKAADPQEVDHSYFQWIAENNPCGDLSHACDISLLPRTKDMKGYWFLFKVDPSKSVELGPSLGRSSSSHTQEVDDASGLSLSQEVSIDEKG